MSRTLVLLLAAATGLTVTTVQAELPPPRDASETNRADATLGSTQADRATTEQVTASRVRLGAYAEAFYQWNFNDPTNDITNFRGFDNRHNSFTLSNAAIDVQWDDDRLIGRLAVQVGHTPSTYYMAEPRSDGASGANGSNAELWKYLQQAYAGYRFGAETDVAISAGLFLSPIGPEAIAVKDNWNLSRSNLFFGLPFYHTGVRVAYALSRRWSLTLAGYNGWNSVVDNNPEKSLATQLVYTSPEVAVSALYFGGVERARGAPEGRAWRNLLDAHVTWNAVTRLSLMAHVNGGLEPNAFGLSRWGAAALYARVGLTEALFLAVRGDAFAEHRAGNADGQASAIFWPVPWVTSGTVTLDFRPHPRVALGLEYRRDHAAGEMFFGRGLERDRATGDYVANETTQDTLTVGLTSWL